MSAAPVIDTVTSDAPNETIQNALPLESDLLIERSIRRLAMHSGLTAKQIQRYIGAISLVVAATFLLLLAYPVETLLSARANLLPLPVCSESRAKGV